MTEARDWHTETAPVQRHDSGRDFGSNWAELPRAEANIAIPREAFEKIYLNPPADVQGDFRNMFANPTPLGLVGFLVATLPLSFQLMGLLHSGGGGQATSGLGFYFGGFLQLTASVMEFTLGNTLSFLVFATFGAAWLALSTNQSWHDAFVAGATGNTARQATPVTVEAEFEAGLAWGLATLGLVVVTLAFFALRTNAVFVLTLFVAAHAVFLLALADWVRAAGRLDAAAEMQRAAGAVVLFCCALAWYLLVANLLEVLEYRWALPVGDLSGRFAKLGRKPAYRDRSKAV